MLTLKEIKSALRAGPYAWPGGYPMYFISLDGAPLSFATVRSNWRRVVQAYLQGWCCDWRLVAIDINWEDETLTCAETDKSIECAYPKE